MGYARTLATNARLLVPASDSEVRAQTASNRLITPANLAARACFRAHKNNVDQSGVAAAGFVKITFTSEAFDIGSYYDTTNSRWIPPAGLVRISGHVTFSSVDDAACQASLYKNGAIFAGGSVAGQISNAGRSVVSAVDLANGTDYYEYYAFCGSTGTFDITGTIAQTAFCGEQI